MKDNELCERKRWSLRLRQWSGRSHFHLSFFWLRVTGLRLVSRSAQPTARCKGLIVLRFLGHQQMFDHKHIVGQETEIEAFLPQTAIRRREAVNLIEFVGENASLFILLFPGPGPRIACTSCAFSCSPGLTGNKNKKEWWVTDWPQSGGWESRPMAPIFRTHHSIIFLYSFFFMAHTFISYVGQEKRKKDNSSPLVPHMASQQSCRMNALAMEMRDKDWLISSFFLIYF